MEGGGCATARPSIVRKEIGGALAWNRGHLPFKFEVILYTKVQLTHGGIYNNILLTNNTATKLHDLFLSFLVWEGIEKHFNPRR